jgi:hypothetical protein
LYGCEAGSAILREEYRLRFFENRVLEKISGPKQVRIPVKWRIQSKEELYDLYCSLIERKGMGEARDKYGGEKKYVQGIDVETRLKEAT